MTCILLLLLLGAPEDTPEAAVERFVSAVRKIDLAGAYDQLGEGARALLEKQVGNAARRVGLDPTTATVRQVIAEFEKRLANDTGKQLAATADVTVLSSKVDGDRATAKVRVAYAGKTENVVLLFVRKQARWRIDGIDTSEARRRANEMAAIATLRNITSAQAQFQATARADENNNGVGEYGTFAELSGATGVRGGKKLVPPVLSSAFRNPKDGVVERSGYYFRIYLHDADGKAIGTGTKGVDPVRAEARWCAYAWPKEYGKTGTRSFFVDQRGDVLARDHQRPCGKTGPKPGAPDGWKRLG
ncbi:MAG: DUF2950 family protein [Planctomycetota bacterium]|jgi:hypothetical protein